MNSKRIVILGAGVGGIVTANELRRLLPKEHRVVVVERNATYSFAPSFLWVMTGARKPIQIQRPLASLLRPGIELIIDTVKSIDSAHSRIETNNGSVEYEFLVVALGADLAFEVVPGLRESAHTYYTLDGAEQLSAELGNCPPGLVAVVVASMPYKCPGAPLEGAMLIADTLKRYRRHDVKVELFTPEPQPMPVAGPQLGKATLEMLASRGIAYHAGQKLLNVDIGAKKLNFDGNRSASYNLLVAIPPHKSPSVVASSPLAAETGWIPVDHSTLQTKVDRVYAIGDVTSVPLPGRWKPDVPLMLPKAGVFAHSQALVVSKRIAGEITGRNSQELFCGDGYCMLEAGEDLAGFAHGNFFAEPSPEVHLKQIGKAWHTGKVLFERWWLAPYGIRRELYRQSILMGGKLMGIPTSL